MNRRTRHLIWMGASVVTAIVLTAPAAAQAGSGADASPASAARGAVAAGSHAQVQTDAATRPGGFDRRDAVVAVATFAGVLVMGLRGYAVVGAVIVGVEAVLGAGARLVTGKPKRRAWADWPSPAVAGIAKQKARQRQPVGRTKAELR